ncbi:MAG: TldD/PmbA family protein [Candidatus Woesearchaeota archaeon]
MQEDLVRFSIDYLRKKGASYAESRLQEIKNNSFIVKNGVLQVSSFNNEKGASIRYILKNTLGFISANELNKQKIKKAIDNSLKLTKAASKINEKTTFTQEKTHKKTYKVPQRIKFSNISPEEKIKLLLDIHKEVKKTKVNLQASFLSFSDNITKQIFMNSEGSKIISEIPRASMFYVFTINENNKSSQRMWENGASGGYEIIRSWNLLKKLPQEAKNLSNILKKGNKIKKGKQDLIVSPEITGIMTHESAGHPTEADRIFGREAAQAGESFIEKNSIGNKIGSEAVTVVDDPTLKNSFGFYLFDDEGVKARRKYLYKKGIITEFLHNRETAPHMNLKSNGSSRASSYNREPIIRMSNTFVLPSKTPEQHLIQEVKRGIYLKSYTEWNIDDKRMNQRYVGAEAYEIKNGKITNPVIHPTIEITTPKLWSSVKLVANNSEYHAGECGKGEPMQGIPVWFGGPSMLIKNVNIY